MPVRICPNCKEPIPIGCVEFDAHNNVICMKCKNPIIATTVEHEGKIKPNSVPAAGPKTVTNIMTPNHHSYAQKVIDDSFMCCP